MALKILPVFGRKQEKMVVELFRLHMKKILEMNEIFKKTAVALFEKRYAEVKKNAVLISDLESEADKLQKKIELGLYEGAFLPETRRQLYMVARWMDEVADALEDATESFVFLKNIKLPKPFVKLLVKMVKHTYDSAAFLNDILEDVLENRQGLQSNITKVHDAESFVDELKEELLRFLFMKAKMKPLDVMVLKGCVDKVDLVSDMAEDCSDYIEMLKIMKQA